MNNSYNCIIIFINKPFPTAMYQNVRKIPALSTELKPAEIQQIRQVYSVLINGNWHQNVSKEIIRFLYVLSVRFAELCGKPKKKKRRMVIMLECF